MREAMTLGEDNFRDFPNFCWTVSELVGSRMRICMAWVRQRVVKVRIKVCSSRECGRFSGVKTMC